MQQDSRKLVSWAKKQEASRSGVLLDSAAIRERERERESRVDAFQVVWLFMLSPSSSFEQVGIPDQGCCLLLLIDSIIHSSTKICNEGPTKFYAC